MSDMQASEQPVTQPAGSTSDPASRMCGRCGRQPALPGNQRWPRCAECGEMPLPERKHRKRHRRSRPRGKTVAPKDLTRAAMAVEQLEPGDAELLAERPRTRGDCAGGERPCPWAGCRYHLAIDVNPETGSIKLNHPDREIWELRETCALDVAERGGITLEEVGEVMNLTRERVRQVETKGLLKLKIAGGHLGDDR